MPTIEYEGAPACATVRSFWQRVPSAKAKKLLNEAITVEEQEVKLKRAYAEKIGKVLTAAKTARYIQIENKIRAIMKFELARQIPLLY